MGYAENHPNKVKANFSQFFCIISRRLDKR